MHFHFSSRTPSGRMSVTFPSFPYSTTPCITAWTKWNEMQLFSTFTVTMKKSIKIVFDDGIFSPLNHFFTVYAVPLRPVLTVTTKLLFSIAQIYIAVHYFRTFVPLLYASCYCTHLLCYSKRNL